MTPPNQNAALDAACEAAWKKYGGAGYVPNGIRAGYLAGHSDRQQDSQPVLERLHEAYAAIGWTQKAPDSSGWYWHWNGDDDCGPLPMSVLYSGTDGRCFVSAGQLGINRAIHADEYGGWWMPIYDPNVPKDQRDEADQELRMQEAVERKLKRKRKSP